MGHITTGVVVTRHIALGERWLLYLNMEIFDLALTRFHTIGSEGVVSLSLAVIHYHV